MKINYSGHGFLKPFHYTIIDDFIDRETVERINEQWPDLDKPCWFKEHGRFNIKYQCQELPPTAAQIVDQIDIEQIERITRINELIKDPDLTGAGLHCIPRGGFLNMHCDFNKHPFKPWARRVNLLLYLNLDWNEHWCGDLCLASSAGEKPVMIAPVAGRAVIFETNETTWHGHPTPLVCPDGIQRRSLAMYFYNDALPGNETHSTIYTKDDGQKRK